MYYVCLSASSTFHEICCYWRAFVCFLVSLILYNSKSFLLTFWIVFFHFDFFFSVHSALSFRLSISFASHLIQTPASFLLTASQKLIKSLRCFLIGDESGFSDSIIRGNGLSLFPFLPFFHFLLSPLLLFFLSAYLYLPVYPTILSKHTHT